MTIIEAHAIIVQAMQTGRLSTRMLADMQTRQIAGYPATDMGCTLNSIDIAIAEYVQASTCATCGE